MKFRILCDSTTIITQSQMAKCSIFRSLFRYEWGLSVFMTSTIHTHKHTYRNKKTQKSNPKQIRINLKLEIDQLNKNLCQSVKYWGITVYIMKTIYKVFSFFLFFSPEHASTYSDTHISIVFYGMPKLSP